MNTNEASVMTASAPETRTDEQVVYVGNDGTTHSRKIGKIGNVTVQSAEIITRKQSAPETRKLSMGERYADIIAEDRKAATGEGDAPRVLPPIAETDSHQGRMIRANRARQARRERIPAIAAERNELAEKCEQWSVMFADKCKTLAQVTAQRDELLAALKWIREHFTNSDVVNYAIALAEGQDVSQYGRAKAAIANAEGRAQ